MIIRFEWFWDIKRGVKPQTRNEGKLLVYKFKDIDEEEVDSSQHSMSSADLVQSSNNQRDIKHVFAHDIL